MGSSEVEKMAEEYGEKWFQDLCLTGSEQKRFSMIKEIAEANKAGYAQAVKDAEAIAETIPKPFNPSDFQYSAWGGAARVVTKLKERCGE